MIRSMTAFARVDETAEWGSAQWELRSVNNRYLDVVTRLPEDLRSLEPAVRERVAGALGRGKVECALRVRYANAADSDLDIDLDLVRRLSDASRKVDAILHDPTRVDSMDVLRWPGVVRSEAQDTEAVGAAVLDMLERALAELVAMREREGARILEMLSGRCAEVREIAAGVRAVLPELLDAHRQRITERLADVAEQLDPERLEQEMAIVASKSDVAEELDRLDAHVEEVLGILGQRKPVGRRLDFLMQELNREANTLGSKSLDTRTTRASVDLKVLIEQMREQIQNVE